MRSKIVEFQKIKVRNFLSYGDDPIEVTFKNGITFITGYNKDEDSKNGVGKTSLIVESLSFLLFGETYRDINQKLIKNNSTGKTCIVEGWLKVNDDILHIVRSLSPNKLILSVNGDSENFTKSIPETTKDIIDRIGISKTIFTNTIVMTNKDSMAFLNQKKDVKNKFIEGILGLEAFADFLKFAKEELKVIDDSKNRKLTQTSQTEAELTNDNLYFNREQEKNKNEIFQISNKIQQLTDCQPVDNTQQIEQLQIDKEALELSLPEKENKVSLASNKKVEIDYNISQRRKTLSQLSGILDNCPSCKRPFEDHNRGEIDKEKSDLSVEIDELVLQTNKFVKGIAKVKADIDQIKYSISSINSKIQNLNTEQQKFVKSQSEIDSLRNQLDRLHKFENPFSDKIVSTTANLNLYKEELKTLIKESSISNSVKDAASPTGVKSIVIRKIIDSLNSRLNHYLVRLRAPFKVYFDEFFDESFVSNTDKEYCYGSLSGGEAKRIDFAMLFAFRDIRRMQSNVHINITVMDELFDSAIDENGMQCIMDLLKENSDECYLIVTHRPQNVEISGCDVIELIKENGITRLNN